MKLTPKNLSEINQLKFIMRAKKLGYSCDLLFDAQYSEGALQLKAQGEVRFALLKSKVEIKSVYQVLGDQDAFLKSYEISHTEKRWGEAYTWNEENDSYLYTKNQEIKQIEAVGRPIIEPLILLFDSVYGLSTEKNSETLHVLMGSKIKEIEKKTSNNKSEFSVGGEVKLEFIKEEKINQLVYRPLKMRFDVLIE